MTKPPLSCFDGLSHAQAVAQVLADPAARYLLRARIQEDQTRDPVDCTADAELLLALHQLRCQEMLGTLR